MPEPKPNPYDEGYAAQKTTYIDECPYPDESDEYRSWHDGYSDADINEVVRKMKSEKRNGNR